MYSGMADVAALTGDAAYVKAIDTIWENTVGQEVYITAASGVGLRRSVRRSLRAAEHDGVHETCASVGNGLLEPSAVPAARRRRNTST